MGWIDYYLPFPQVGLGKQEIDALWFKALKVPFCIKTEQINFAYHNVFVKGLRWVFIIFVVSCISSLALYKQLKKRKQRKREEEERVQLKILKKEKVGRRTYFFFREDSNLKKWLI